MISVTDIVADFINERASQIEKHGYDFTHDDEHTDGEIANLAACFCAGRIVFDHRRDSLIPDGWVFNGKPTRRQELIVAGALILAEIQRLDRAEGK